MITLLANLFLLISVLAVVWWIVGLLPLPHPFPTILQALIVLIGLVLVVDLLLSALGSPARWPLLR